MMEKIGTALLIFFITSPRVSQACIRKILSSFKTYILVDIRKFLLKQQYSLFIFIR